MRAGPPPPTSPTTGAKRVVTTTKAALRGGARATKTREEGGGKPGLRGAARPCRSTPPRLQEPESRIRQPRKMLVAATRSSQRRSASSELLAESRPARRRCCAVKQRCRPAQEDPSPRAQQRHARALPVLPHRVRHAVASAVRAAGEVVRERVRADVQDFRVHAVVRGAHVDDLARS